MKKSLIVSLLSSTLFGATLNAMAESLPTVLEMNEHYQLNGTVKTFYNTGKLKSNIPFRDNLIHGTRQEFYRTGKLIAELPYERGILNGVLKQYYPSGKLKFEVPFKDNTLNGDLKEYYKTGKLKAITPFKEGKKEGIGKIYNPSGKEKIALFKGESFHSLIQVYSESGKLLTQIEVTDGKVSSGLATYQKIQKFAILE